MGKFGIILAFLLSVAAAGGSYYLYQGWVEARTVRGVVEAKYDQAKEKIITVQSEKEKIKTEKEQIAAKSEKYRIQAEAMQAQVGKLQTEQKLADSEKAALANQLEDRQRMIAELKTKMEELEQKAKDAQAACGVTPADLGTNPLSAAQPVTNAPASATAGSVTGTPQLVFKPVTPAGTPVRTAAIPSPATRPVQEVSARPGTSSSVNPVATATPSTQTAAAAATTGPKVLTVNRKFNFVVINQGLQDGLKMGDKLKVLKQGQEVAVVQIEKLYDKFSAATLMSENPKQQVVEGDEIRKA
jgi:ribosomal protein S17